MACAAWVDPGQRVADIGTDHGYLAIYLLRSGRARRVLAADIAPQPLERARAVSYTQLKIKVNQR